MIWTRMLAYITGTVDQELLLTNEYLKNRKLVTKCKDFGLKGSTCSKSGG
jgi:hypothetical protein